MGKVEGCVDCERQEDVESCTVCQRPVCPRHRSGTGRLQDGYQCSERDCWFRGYSGRAKPLEDPTLSAFAVAEHEQVVCEFLEALLKLEYPGRRVAVTVAPLESPSLIPLPAGIDRSDVVDVLVGAHEKDPAWVIFRCSLAELERRDWLAACTLLLERTKAAFDEWRAKHGGTPPPIPASRSLQSVASSLILETLREAARRANWDAQQGPLHLRTGRFTGDKKEPS